MRDQHPALARAVAFCEAFHLRVPILMAPMAGACPPSLAIAVANAGGLGGCGALMMEPGANCAWASQVRAASNGAFQINLWIPDPPRRQKIVLITHKYRGSQQSSREVKPKFIDSTQGETKNTYKP